MAPVRHCVERGCPNLTSHNRCPEHQRIYERNLGRSSGRRGSTRAWRKLRDTIISRDSGRCVICGTAANVEVHHIDGDPTNDNHFNLQTLCERCHDAVTTADLNRRTPMVVLAGRCGVGKTAVRGELARALRCTSLGPDEFDGDWRRLIAKLQASEFAVVECVRIPSQLRPLLSSAYVVVLTASMQTRARRLAETDLPSAEASKRAAQDWDIAYGSPVTIDATIETDDRTPAEISNLIRRHTKPDTEAPLSH